MKRNTDEKDGRGEKKYKGNNIHLSQHQQVFWSSSKTLTRMMTAQVMKHIQEKNQEINASYHSASDEDTGDEMHETNDEIVVDNDQTTKSGK